MKKRTWDEKQLRTAVKRSKSIRAVISALGLIPAGGNYVQIKASIHQFKINTAHFTGKGWSKGVKKEYRPLIPLQDILIKGSTFQSFKLKKRLFNQQLFDQQCSLCGWAKKSTDGRIPLELDHINGDRFDNRIENLRILCPNCHSLQPTHRGKNKKKKRMG